VTRWLIPSNPLYLTSPEAVKTLREQGAKIYISPQVLTEYWALATRPALGNGLGLTVAQALSRVRLLQRGFSLLPDTPMIYPLWQSLVEKYLVIGRQVYDARLVAVMQAYNLTHVLTYNGNHFQRYSGITVIDPANV
jgi:predicted nucleic acid-binding protein